MRTIVSIVTSCRISFDDPEMVDRVYRYINLCHAACYVGLTDTYTVENFFMPICHKHQLFAPEGSEARRREALAMERVSLDGEGSRAWSMFHLWALEVINEEYQRGAISAPFHAQIIGQMHVVADAQRNLYAFTYQVLPFIYTHLVSFSCTVYLLASAFMSGLAFQPGASIMFGLGMPLATVLLNTVTIFGLLEVGDTILEPFGSDSEDFAVLHFVDYVATASKEAATVWGVKESFAPAPAPTGDSLAAAKVKSFARRVRNNVPRSATSEPRPVTPPTWPVATSDGPKGAHSGDEVKLPERRREVKLPEGLLTDTTEEYHELLMASNSGSTQGRRASTGPRRHVEERGERSNSFSRSPSRTATAPSSRSGLKGGHPGRSRAPSPAPPTVSGGACAPPSSVGSRGRRPQTPPLVPTTLEVMMA